METSGTTFTTGDPAQFEIDSVAEVTEHQNHDKLPGASLFCL